MTRVPLVLGGLGAVVLAGVGLVRPLGDKEVANAIDGIVVITLDTTRADRLSPYGFMDAVMPHLERIAAEGVVFDQASSVAPLTLPAHTSLFTGLRPPKHGVRDNADRPLAPEQRTLAETVRERGFRTGAFVGSAVLDPDRGLSQGFDMYGGVAGGPSLDAGSLQRRADVVVADSLAWLEGVGTSPFMLWTHLYDSHAPYDPPEPFRSAHPDPYLGEILFMDAQIGRLLEGLDRLRLSDRTVVVIAADHGEGLGEHGEKTHGLSVFESVLRVPLIIRAPSLKPRRLVEPVSLVDVMPTVLELLGFPAREADGRSLVGAMHGETGPEAEVYAESMYPTRFGRLPVRALRDGRYKLIDGNVPALYDLARDPFEARNIHGERAALAQLMRARLTALAGNHRSPDAALGEVTGEVRERLEALGYVGRTASASPGGR
jgi:arylsulfatase A-like enzyme